jgi:SAM-dependent methyltransferase
MHLFKTLLRWKRGPDPRYLERLAQEVSHYRSVENVHDLPDIFNYWADRYLLPKFQPFGFTSPTDFFRTSLLRLCRDHPGESQRFVSIGAGNCDTEIGIAEQLRAEGMRGFVLECLDINPHMLDRGRRMAQEKQVADVIRFTEADINSWRPRRSYQAVMANQSLHHFLELETLFDKVHDALATGGVFLADDMIGRNGHMRWPEALVIVNRLWSELPERCKYNHQLKRVELEFDNWDCSKEGFEGIRSQDILPLLLERFGFELFVAFGNVIDIFVDRSFGHNFDRSNASDVAFIDRVHAIDENHLERGAITPTHMTAAMVKDKAATPRIYKHMTPEFCVRWPDEERFPA